MIKRSVGLSSDHDIKRYVGFKKDKKQVVLTASMVNIEKWPTNDATKLYILGKCDAIPCQQYFLTYKKVTH